MQRSELISLVAAVESLATLTDKPQTLKLIQCQRVNGLPVVVLHEGVVGDRKEWCMDARAWDV